MHKSYISSAVGLSAFLSPASAVAAEYLTVVTSQMYLTAGTPKEIATRGSTCISQHLAPGTTTSQLIISSDLEGGTIIARNAISYPDGLIQWQVRSTFTFEARDGRFRIEQANLERFNERGAGWGQIGKWKFSGWLKAQDAFATSAAAVAACVVTGPKKADW